MSDEPREEGPAEHREDHHHEDHFEELLHRERAELPLSPQERLVRLEHLRRCSACRFLEDARGDLFDEVARPVNGKSISELVTATMASFEPASRPAPMAPQPSPARLATPRRRAHARLPALTAALVCAVAGVALAAHWIGGTRREEAPLPSPRSQPATPAPRGHGGQPNGPAFSQSGAPPPQAKLPSAEGPAALFARATEARQAGRVDEARLAYDRLWQDFPGSLEAQTSLVARGRWLLDRNEAQAAATAFADYLRAAPGGPLAAEASVGLAESLEQARDWPRARQAWQDVLANPAAGLQSAQARARLRALERLVRRGADATEAP